MAPSELRWLLRQQPVSTYAASDIVSMPISSDTMCVGVRDHHHAGRSRTAPARRTRRTRSHARAGKAARTASVSSAATMNAPSRYSDIRSTASIESKY
jgi:hypothetical protein